MKELHKTCMYLSIKFNLFVYQCKNKQEYIDTITPYCCKHGNNMLPYRIQINFQNEYYYINRPNPSFRSFIKKYNDELREVYKLTMYNGKMKVILKYKKIEHYL